MMRSGRYLGFAAALVMAISAVAQAQEAGVTLEQRTENPYADTYEGVHEYSQSEHWGPYNVHDPALFDDGAYVYSYSTDVSWGKPHERVGIMVRRTKDMVNWEFRGWAYDGRPKEAVADLDAVGGRTFENLWAPCMYKHGDEYRLYYSLSSHVPKNSNIGLLTGPSAEGPWTESGLVVVSRRGKPGTNAIDPAVVVSPEGEHWMYYGSAWDGIYALRLNPETGLAMEEGDRGVCVAQRGNTNGKINGNIEGPEILYHPGFKKYYLFIAYDWLFTKYNVRVARSDKPEGPFVDYYGNPVNTHEDQGPMILSPYRFENHPGWQGVSHPGVVEKDGAYYLASQGRPANGAHFMVMHARRMYWTSDGWPVVSPERYAGPSEQSVGEEDLAGSWELMNFSYEVIPGFASEQIDSGFCESHRVTFLEDGTIRGSGFASWRWEDGRVYLTSRLEGQDEIELLVDRAWDWENESPTIILTGLNAKGYPVWAKRR